jgi:CBS domain containing-hemolysin-like protein
MNLLLLTIVITILFSAFFSGMEMAFIKSNKLRLEIHQQSGPFRHRLLRMITRHPGYFNATMLTGWSISLVAFCIGSSTMLRPVIQTWFASGWGVLLWLTIIQTAIIVVFGIFLPKAISANFPDSLMIILYLPLAFFYLLFYPVTWLIMTIVRFSARDSHRKTYGIGSENKELTLDDLDHFVNEEESDSGSSENKVEKEVILFRNALDFSKVKLHEIMVPRNEIAVLDINSDVETLRKKFIETGFSKILFYEDNKDNIIGYVHTSAIFQKAKSIKPFLMNVLVVPETMAANKLLSKFIREHRSIALVVDEFGGTAGLVTSEDILEEIFGEIEDEHDSSDFIEKKINENQYVLSGRIEIDTLNEKYKLNIQKSDEYETLAGFILFYHESIPKPGTVLRIERFNIKILKATQTKIELVQVNIL